MMCRFQAGDAMAFEELSNRYRSMVLATIVSVVGQSALAEDLTQLVFLKIWANPLAFHGGSFLGWSRTVARNQAIDEQRRNGHITLVTLDSVVDCGRYASCFDAAFEGLLSQSQSERLRESLQILSELQRSLIELNFFAGLSHSEISARTGLPIGMVKTRIRSAIRRLRSLTLDDDSERFIHSGMKATSRGS